MITTNQLFSLWARQNEIARCLKAGSLQIDDVLEATQDILDGKLQGNGPTEYLYVAQVENQLIHWKNLGIRINAETRKRIIRQAQVF